MYKNIRTFKNYTVRIIISVFFTAGVMAQEVEVVSTAQPAEAYIRGDMVPQTPEVPGKKSTFTHQIEEKRDIWFLWWQTHNSLLKTCPNVQALLEFGD